MNLATTFNLRVALRPEMCPKVLTIKTCETITVQTDDGPITAHQLVTTGPDGVTYTVRLNAITAEQLVRLFGPETDAMTGKQVLASTYAKGDRSYISFAPAPLPTPTNTTRPAGVKATTIPTKNRKGQPQLTEATKQVLKESAAINS